MINPYLGMVGIMASLFFTHFKRSWTFGIVLLLVLIVVGLGDEVIGYHENSPIHKDNIQTAKSIANNENISKITILSYNDEPYGWVSPPFSEWAEMYFKKYYNIPDSVSIKYEEFEEE